MGEEVLEAVADESDGQAPICGSCRCKTVSQGLQTVDLEQFLCSLLPGSVSTHLSQCGVPTIAARCISHRGTLHQPSQHAASAIAARSISPRSTLRLPSQRFEFPSHCACFNRSVMSFFSRIRYHLPLPSVPPFPSFFCPACRKFMVLHSQNFGKIEVYGIGFLKLLLSLLLITNTTAYEKDKSECISQ